MSDETLIRPAETASPARLNVLILLAMLLFCATMLWPIWKNPNQILYGFVHDNVDTLWKLWSKQHVIWNDQKFRGFELGNFPGKMDLFNDLMMYTNEIYHWIVACFFSPKYAILAYNVSILVKYFVCSVLMTLLLLKLKCSLPVSVTLGLLYSFNPYFQPLVQAYGSPFIPCLLPLLLSKLYDFLTLFTLQKFVQFAIVFLVFFGENYYVSYFTCVTLFVSLILFAIYRFKFLIEISKNYKVKEYLTKNKIILMAVFSVFFGFLFLLLNILAPYIKGRVFDLTEAVTRSANPLFYFIPSIGNSIFGTFFEKKIWQHTGNLEVYERAIYLGYSGLLFVILVCYLRFKVKQSPNRALFSFVWIAIAVSVALSLGPIISLSGRWGPLEQRLSGPHFMGPAYPFFVLGGMFRFISRYHFLTITFFLILIALSLTYVSQLKNMRPKRSQTLIFVIFLGLFLEYSHFPSPQTTDFRTIIPKAFGHSYLANESFSKKTVAMYPFFDFPNWLLGQSFQVAKNFTSFRGRDSSFYASQFSKTEFENSILDVPDFIILITKMPLATRPPLQIYWPQQQAQKLEQWHEIKNYKLIEKFDDSLLFQRISVIK